MSLGQYDNIKRLFGDEDTSVFSRASVLLTISSVAYATLLIVIDRAVRALHPDSDDQFMLLLLQFIAFFAVYTAFRWLALVHSIRLADGLVTKLWTRIVDQLRRLELQSVEELDQGKVYADLSSDLGTLSTNAFRILFNIQDALLIFIFLAYLSAVSLVSMCIAIAATACVIYTYTHKPELASSLIRQVKISEAQLLNSLNSVFYGFKEMKLNAKRSDAVFETFQERAVDSEQYRVKVGDLVFCRELFSQTSVYAMLGAVVFILPQFQAIDVGVLPVVVTLLVFFFLPLSALTVALDMGVYADGILAQMYELERDIEKRLNESPPVCAQRTDSPYRDFRRLKFSGLRFSYGKAGDNGDGFSLGPLDLEINRGEIIFLVGGNGAGKSTAFKLLTGLYRPHDGELLVDGEVVPWALIGQYRQIVSAVFGDFHLFDKFYGIDDANEERVARWLHFMQLDTKVTFSDGRFSTQDLSTGQKKRLALITSLMEDREIVFLDEWAADQDWQFRAYFYEEILPELRRLQKTVVAITHDRKYLQAADRVVRLELGRLIPSEPSDEAL